MIATGNHYYLDSLRGAPPPEGGSKGLYEFAQAPLASPGGKLDFLAIGTSEPIAKKD